VQKTGHKTISPSRHVRVLGALLLGFCISWLASVVYLFTLDTPLEYLMRETNEQDRWSQHFKTVQGPRLIVTGGSSCTFSIDGGMATEQFHVPVINGGLEAGIGTYGVFLLSSRLTEPGDTLVLAIEPPLLLSSLDYTQDTLQFMIRRLEWGLLLQAKEVTGRAVPLDRLFFSPRPGLENFAAFLGRLVTHTPFRYENAKIRPGGLMVTDIRYPLSEDGYTPGLSPVNRDVLLHFRDWASHRGVRIVYSIPWYYLAKERARDQQRINARFVAILSEIVPVVREEEFGVRTDRSLFADTNWHLTEEAAQARTSELVKLVLAGDFWTTERLERAASAFR
jgi:hypothetical protein